VISSSGRYSRNRLRTASGVATVAKCLDENFDPVEGV
jgi:hypothetical protein